MTALILAGAYAMTSDLATPAEFDRKTGTKQNFVHVAFPMQDGATMIGFPQTLLDSYWQQGQLTMLSWGTWDYHTGHAWTWPDILSGKYDQYLHTWAQAAAAWRHPFFIRLNHEVNGTWSNLPYLALIHADPAGFLASWKHIVDLFRSDGALNATWVWCINAVAPAGAGTTTDADKVAALYPGDQWVDWTSFDAYNWAGSKQPAQPWLTWQQITSGYSNWIGDTYGTLTALSGRPILVGEFGCETRGGPTGVLVNGDRTAWILDALQKTPVLYPQIGALSYFHRSYTNGPFWALDGYDGMAWKVGVQGPGYVQPGFLMPPDLVPIAPYRLVAMSGTPVIGVDQTKALADAVAATQAAQAAAGAAQGSQAALEGLVRARKAAGAAEDAAVD